VLGLNLSHNSRWHHHSSVPRTQFLFGFCFPSNELLGYFQSVCFGGARFISEVLGKKAGVISIDQLAGSLRGADETRPPCRRTLKACDSIAGGSATGHVTQIRSDPVRVELVLNRHDLFDPFQGRQK
jgi:hypothetical protein